MTNSILSEDEKVDDTEGKDAGDDAATSEEAEATSRRQTARSPTPTMHGPPGHLSRDSG